MQKRKIPLRKCVVTQEMKPKQEMIRVVRSPEGIVSVDPTGKKAGRGTYLTKTVEVINLAKQRNVLGKQLQANVDPSVYEDLINLVGNES
ncbi:RNA-binding protein [Lottiidibacillus patelloidae]|uniref:RNA-binding protein n=1 Tax=Lottiidibacillus patelloidae TaxID=2670334 RepID=A0A263BXX0_9BACI|nr:YlxR family protein [Lottiidibacillus patelloidae]OZM58611.1 RNA-binding protein [Lottiidibacillus patelloidae]